MRTDTLSEHDRGYAFGYNHAMDDAVEYGRWFAERNLEHLVKNRPQDDFDQGYLQGFKDYLARS